MGETAGKIIIETRVDNKQLEKGLNNQKRQLKQYEKEAEELLTLRTKTEKDLEPYKKETDDLWERVKAYKEQNISEEQKNQLIARLQPELDAINEKYAKQLEANNRINDRIEENARNQEKLKNEIIKSEQALKQAKLVDSFEDIGKSIEKNIKKVIRWGLAVFGIRGAYMAVRNAINVISQDDKQLKADIDYMKNAFAYTLEPVVRSIVNLAKELMIAIQNIVYTLTGKNIFENANKSLAKANKNAQALNKTMAKFDEMQTVGNQSSGGGTDNPSFDLSKINEMSKTGQGLVGIIAAISGAIAAMKLSELLKTLGLINGELTIMQGLGIFGLILSIYNIIVDLKDIWEKFDETVEGNNTTLRDWGDVLKWVGIGIVSIGLILGGLPAIIIGVIVAIFAIIMKYWDDIKTFFTEKVFGWIDKQIEKLEKTTIGQFFANILREVKLKITQVMVFLDDTFNRIKRLFDGITKLFKDDSSGWRDIFGAMLNGIIRKLNSFINGINSMLSQGSALLSGLGKIFGANWNVNVRIPNIPYLAKGGIINMPGRGVPVGSAIVGERGQEGVIPLTDSQQMALLGEAIGKYITMNATVPVYIGNRLVMREMKRIEAEDNFAYNR